MGKASRRLRQGSATATRTEPAPVSAAMVGVLAAVMPILSVLPYGPFHVLPAVTRIPLAAILSLSMLSGIPRLARFNGRRAALALEAAGLAVILGTWFLLKLVGLHPSGTDDNIYFYLANRVAEGAVPYRDFFFSHPPVHLLVPAAVFKIAGYSIGAAKLIPVLAQTIAGLFMYLTLRPVSRPMALFALFAHFSTYQILMGSTDMNCENIMTMFLWAAAWAGFRRFPVVAGVLAGLAIGTGMYALAGVLAVGIAILVADRRPPYRIHWHFYAADFRNSGGKWFFDGVFHHQEGCQRRGKTVALFKSPALQDGGDPDFQPRRLKGPTFLKTPIRNCHVPPLPDMDSRAGHPRLSNRCLEAHFIALPALRPQPFSFYIDSRPAVYDFYLVPMLSFMCPAVGYYVIAVSAKRASGASSLLSLFLRRVAAVPWSAHLNAALWPEESKLKGQKVAYEWRDPAILKGPAGLTKALFFADSRERGAITPYYRHYIWNKSLAFDSVDEIADFVRQNTIPEQTLTGASTLAPLVALHAGRRISADEADTNGKRFSSGMLSDAGFIDQVCADKVAFVVSASGSYFPFDKMTSAEPFKSRFQPARTFNEKKLKHFKDFPITLFKTRENIECGRM